MKKLLITALVVSGACIGVVNASPKSAKFEATVSGNDNTTAFEEKLKIKPEELPEGVKKTLAGDDYKGWEIVNAYQYKESSTYEVEVKKAAETKTLKFDKDGKVVK